MKVEAPKPQPPATPVEPELWEEEEWPDQGDDSEISAEESYDDYLAAPPVRKKKKRKSPSAKKDASRVKKGSNGKTWVITAAAVASVALLIFLGTWALSSGGNGDAPITEGAEPSGTQMTPSAITVTKSDTIACEENLKKIGIALYAFHDQHRIFPFGNFDRSDEHPDWFDENGHPHLSWRVHLLPYVGEDELYQRFKLNESWESEHNSQLLSEVPAVFRSRGVADRHTIFQVPEYQGAVGSVAEGVSLRDISDDHSGTILVVASSGKNAVQWTKPNDFQFPKGAEGLQVWPSPNGTNFKEPIVLLANGSLTIVSRQMDESLLHSLLTINGGEVVGEISTYR